MKCCCGKFSASNLPEWKTKNEVKAANKNFNLNSLAACFLLFLCKGIWIDTEIQISSSRFIHLISANYIRLNYIILFAVISLFFGLLEEFETMPSFKLRPFLLTQKPVKLQIEWMNELAASILLFGIKAKSSANQERKKEAEAESKKLI